VIAGDGPLRLQLERLRDELGLEANVALPAVWGEEVVRLLEDADVFAMPCVVATDGDRDSMPVVVKEALAMELPVVGSDEVGIPEMIRPAWGRLVPPGDPVALAQALEEILALDPAERAAMGAAGRRFVVENCNVWHETRKLVTLFQTAK
jgi:colanic acid/amylovoran biosynthesis glycosyltransferase